MSNLIENAAGELRRMVYEGAAERYGSLPDEVLERVEYELSVMEGHEAYFLMVRSIVDWAHENGIAVGPGRGRAPESVVCYCLEITRIDPIEHGLLFDSFMVPGGEPDIDLDVEYGAKERVLRYIRQQFGDISVDVLELKALSVLKEILQKVQQRHGVAIDLDAIPLDDAETLALYAAGETEDVFQFESEGMREYMRHLKEPTFDTLSAMNALYRPGAMDWIPVYIEMTKGGDHCDIPCVKEALGRTSGLLVYQEQMMLLSKRIAGFTPEEADRLRKAAAKKDMSELDVLRERFIQGGVKNGRHEHYLVTLWSVFTRMGPHLFNQAHSYSYVWLSFKLAWLKVHYPREYGEVVG